jgi:uncharacterized membrane protein
MAEDNSTQKEIRRIAERLDYLEYALREQIARLYTIEQHLGITPRPTKPAPPPQPTVSDRVETAPPETPSVPPITTEPPAPIESVLPLIKQTPASLPPSSSVSPVDELPAIHAEPERQEPVSAPQSFRGAQEATSSEPESRSEERAGRDLESLIGGSWFNFIGIVAIFLGVAFFFQLAIQQGWIGQTGRVIIGIVVGLGFLLGGEYARSRGYRYFAQGLSGGGIAILYVSIFAAFARYHLIEQLPAFLFMSLVTATAVMLAARYDALAIAILGLLGGFLTPILLSTGKDNPVGLFSYITLLDLGVLALAYFKQWRVLNYLAYVATVLMAAAWMSEWYAPEKLWTAVFFFTVFFVIFALLAVFHNIINRRPTAEQDLALILINAALYFGTTYKLLEPQYHPYLGLFAVLVSAFYLGLGYLTYLRDREDRYLVLTFLGLASLFLTLAVPIQLDQHWVTMGWAIEGVVLTWIGLRTGSTVTRYGAGLVFAIAAAHWLDVDRRNFAYQVGQAFTPLLNRRAVSALVLIASLSAAAWLYRRLGEQIEEDERRLFSGACALGANVLAVTWLSLDVKDYFDQIKELKRREVGQAIDGLMALNQIDNTKLLALSLLWSIYGGAALAVGIARRMIAVRIGAFVLLGLTACKVVMLDAGYYAAPWHTLLLNQTFGSFAALIAVLVAGIWLYKGAEGIEPNERQTALSVLIAAANLLALIALSLEASGYFEARMSGSDETRIVQLASSKQFTLTALWSLYAAAAVIVGIRSRWRWLRYGALGLLTLTTFQVLFTALNRHFIDGRAPVFNQTFGAFAFLIAALVCAVWYYSRAEGMGETEHTLIIPVLIAAANFLAILALSLEAHDYFEATIRRSRPTDENLRDLHLAQQLSLSVVWALYGGAMLVFGIWRQHRLLRIMALILLGMTIIKVFLIDLASLDRIYRIISFIVLGAILLVVSFLYQRSQRRASEGRQ